METKYNKGLYSPNSQVCKYGVWTIGKYILYNKQGWYGHGSLASRAHISYASAISNSSFGDIGGVWPYYFIYIFALSIQSKLFIIFSTKQTDKVQLPAVYIWTILEGTKELDMSIFYIQLMTSAAAALSVQGPLRPGPECGQHHPCHRGPGPARSKNLHVRQAMEPQIWSTCGSRPVKVIQAFSCVLWMSRTGGKTKIWSWSLWGWRRCCMMLGYKTATDVLRVIHVKAQISIKSQSWDLIKKLQKSPFWRGCARLGC